MAFITKLRTTRWVLPDPPKPKSQWRRVASSTAGAVKITAVADTYTIVDKSTNPPTRVNTGFTRKELAEQALTEYKDAKQYGAAGAVNPKALKAAPIGDHVAAYLAHCKKEGQVDLDGKKRILETAIRLAGIATLADFTPDRVDRYLTAMTQANRTVMKHRSKLHSFAAWLVKKKKLARNPVTNALRPKDAPKRQPRAFTADELSRLFQAARTGPLATGAVNKGGRPRRDGTRPGPSPAKLTDEARAALALLGRERELCYRTVATLGLRRGEAKALTVYDLKLDGPTPFVRLAAFDPFTGDQAVKSEKALILPVVPTLAEELRQWVLDTGRQPGDSVFGVPTLRTFKKDMKRAGVPYKDARGRTADFHSLRRSTGTMLAVANVPPKEAQSYMRHSDIRLTLQVYADAGVVGMGNAVDAMSRVPA
jgi:integrase